MIVEALPQVELLTFSSSTQFGIEKLKSYYRNCNYRICEYSIGIKLMYEQVYRYAFAEAHGCLICRDEYDGITYFDYPIAGEKGNIEAALEEIEKYCLEKDIPLRFTTLPHEVLGALTARYDGVRLQNTYRYRDYFYRVSDISAFEGKRYAGQRNHIRRFERNYPNAVFRRMTARDLPSLACFMDRFNAHFQKDEQEATEEKDAAFRLLQMDNESDFRIGCMELDGEIIGVALGEKCGDTLVEHIEKALSFDYEGIYPAMFQAFVRMFAADCVYINREDDAADRGLRTSKMQYHPCFMTQKYDMDVLNVASFVSEIPTLHTQRLTLDAILRSDADAYGALCLDDARNRYWGYDYRDDFADKVPNGLDFCRMAEEDFRARRAINFAVRLNGRLIGEVILYRFDNRGGAEIGVRILPAFSGLGYGREAFAAVSDWALYGLNLVALHAKCFRENTASAKMLSLLMRQNGEDGRMLSFIRQI